MLCLAPTALLKSTNIVFFHRMLSMVRVLTTQGRRILEMFVMVRVLTTQGRSLLEMLVCMLHNRTGLYSLCGCTEGNDSRVLYDPDLVNRDRY